MMLRSSVRVFCVGSVVLCVCLVIWCSIVFLRLISVLGLIM